MPIEEGQVRTFLCLEGSGVVGAFSVDPALRGAQGDLEVHGELEGLRDRVGPLQDQRDQRQQQQQAQATKSGGGTHASGHRAGRGSGTGPPAAVRVGRQPSA
jgi:hypothetical protein